MNLQDILEPIEALILWSFGFLKAGGNYVNYLIIIIIAMALVYWTIKLAGYQSSEVPNR